MEESESDGGGWAGVRGRARQLARRLVHRPLRVGPCEGGRPGEGGSLAKEATPQIFTWFQLFSPVFT